MFDEIYSMCDERDELFKQGGGFRILAGCYEPLDSFNDGGDFRPDVCYKTDPLEAPPRVR